MAYYFDEMGQYVEYETEEERKRREEIANTAVQTQEIKTYGDGTVERITKEEVPAAAQAQPVAAQPVAQQPARQTQPVNPEVFQRMLQAESGGRQNDPRTGQIMTSPKGALGIGQIMPSTAMQPGYGVPNIFDLAQRSGIQVANRDQATARQLLGNEQLNREFAEKYASAMTQRFGEQGGVAAYNAGPGRVGRNVQANAGQLNVGQLPSETQGYVQKVLPQQAGAGRGTMGMPQAVPGEGVAVATGSGVQGTMQTQQQPTTINRFLDLQDDPIGLMAVKSGATDATDFERAWAGDQLFQNLNKEVETAKAQKQLEQLGAAAAAGDRKANLTLSRELQKQEGSYLKMILLGFISPTLAGEEAVKLGYGNKWMTSRDANGKSALIQFNAKGMPLKGYTEDGNEIAGNELVRYAAGAGKKQDYDIVGGTFVSDTLKDKDGRPLVGSVYRSKTNPDDSFVQTAEGRKPLTGFRPQSSAGSLEDQRTRTIQDINLRLRGKGIEESMNILREYNQRLVGAGFAPVQPGEVGINVPQIGGAAAAPAQGQSAAEAAAQGGKITPLPTTQAAPAAPAGTAAAPAGARPTMSQLEAQAAAAKETAQEVGKDLGVTAVNFNKAKDSAMVLINQAQSLIDDPGFSVSVGASAQPFFQYIPGSDKATWMAKKEEVVGKTFLTAIESLKGFGALSDQEGRAATAAISRLNNTNQNEASYKAAVKELQDIVKRGVDRNAAKLGKPSVFGTEEFTEKTKESAMSPADKARAELERRRKEKK